MVEELLSGQNELALIGLVTLAFLIFLGIAIVVFFIFSRKKIVKTELEKANLEIEYQKELLQSTLVTQEEERKRIAQDLHDAISSKLNVVSLNANMLAGVEDPEEVQKIGENIRKITGTVLENSRRIAHDLLPPTLEKFGLQAALEELCEEVDHTQAFEIHSNIDYPDGKLTEKCELHLFRIVQELLNNSIKHSGAKNIEVALTTEGKGVSLHYKDDGKGFDLEKARKAKGLGMSGIENRAQLLDAKLEIFSEPNKGIDVTIKCKGSHEN